MTWRALPYVAAAVIGFQWHVLPLWVSVPTLLICAYLLYVDLKD